MALRDIKSKPTNFTPVREQIIVNNSRVIQSNFEKSAKTNVESTSSFRYDAPGSGMRSTQQVSLDWSKFENHTFFNSAEANVNVAFSTIINGYPYDGTKKETEDFFDKLTGFEKWVYDQFPKNKGYLFFSGTQTGEDHNGTHGTFISVKDFAGSLYPSLSRLTTAEGILDPSTGSFAIEMQLYLPSIANNVQVICQKVNDSDSAFPSGLQLLLASGTNLTTNLIFGVASGSYALSASVPLQKGQFNHICAVYDREGTNNNIKMYVNETFITQSSESFDYEDFHIKSNPFIIGSGTNLQLDGGTAFLPQQTLSGALDDFRFFHSIRTLDEQKLFAKKGIFADEKLKLYYKFNEPSGTIGPDAINRIVIDSSGNSLHAQINSNGFFTTSRMTSSLDNPMVHEKLNLCPVLFPAYAPLSVLNNDLLLSASAYDAENPNLITKLIPAHYFINGQTAQGMTSENGTLGDAFTGNSIPGSGQLGTAQLLSSFLYVWGKFFDEIKIFTDAFNKMKYVNYDSTDTIPDMFLLSLAKQYGFHLPSFFNDSSIEQFIDAENIQDEISTSQYTLRHIQNQILRRILTNLQEFIKSKGTIHSVKAFMRAFGVNPDNSFRIREFGGPTSRTLEHSREIKMEPGTMLKMSSGDNLISPPLSSSRVELGFPEPSGMFVNKSSMNIHGISNAPNDGLMTSGSWTYEGIYKFPNSLVMSSNTQSLAYLGTVGGGGTGLIANLVATSGSLIEGTLYPSTLSLFVRPGISTDANTAPLLILSFPNVPLFDGDKWNVSFGCNRNDEFGSVVSSSYFLRLAKSNGGEVLQSFITSSLFQESTLPDHNVLHVITGSYNDFGPKLCIGPHIAFFGISQFLQDSIVVPSELARTTTFEGFVSQMRFWSKGLSLNEWNEHVKNPKSLGVDNPLVNFNFTPNATGSFSRLRLDANTMQTNRDTNAFGLLNIFDYSQNNLHMSGTFGIGNTTVINPEMFNFSFISPAFDEANSSEKVRIRSFQDDANLNDSPWAAIAPIYRVEPSETPTDDTRFSIEFSIIDALDRDIVNIFSSLDGFNNYIGRPELMFSPDYPDLELLRDVYFNRLTDKINLKSFFEFFKWFDTSIGSFIQQLIPRKTVFFGVNYVIESHMLERPKIEYQFNKMWLSKAERPDPSNTFTLEEFQSSLKRY